MLKQAYVYNLDDIVPFMRGADYVDTKSVISDVSLREFVAAMLNHQPGWIKFLYWIRARFVRLLGLRQTGMPRPVSLRPETVPMKIGSKASFFTVCLAVENRYWIAEVKDKHLSAALGVVVEPLESDIKRFHVVTTVHYHNWAGPVYFNIIRPFHHLVVVSMLRAGSRGV